MSQITTHILDTSRGKPAAGVNVVLEKPGSNDAWVLIGNGKTNSDGRVPELLHIDVILAPGTYRLTFDTGGYFNSHGINAFYPSVSITFQTADTSHYHVPLLLNPFGYSTYRGS